jgi:hypothetical protein
MQNAETDSNVIDIKTPREQQTLPAEGMARKKIPAIEKAASKYRAIRDERMALTKEEVQARNNLVDAMTDNEVDVYKFDDAEGEELTVELDTTTKVKVKKAADRDHLDD